LVVSAGHRRYSEGEGSCDPEDEADGSTEPEPDSEGDRSADPELEPEEDAGDASTDPDGIGADDGVGSGVGSGMNRDGISRKERTKMSTKMAATTKSHGRASRSWRVGRAPR
jgi:hypothetical protein